MAECCNWTYFCPEAKEKECIVHGGFDVCCEHADCPALGRTRRGVLARVGDAMAAQLHEDWRRARNYEPRIKTDEEGNSIDIAALAYADLPLQYQLENRTAARHAVTVASYSESMEEAAEEIHEAWLVRNRDWAEPHQAVPFSELSREEQEKDEALVIRARTALGMEPL